MRTFNRTTESLAIELADAKAQAIAAVNEAASAVRLQLGTDIPFQDLVYAEKRAEAIAFVAAIPEPTDLTPYRFIEAEVGITAPTAAEVAQVYLNLNELWRQAGSALEGIRLGAVASIEAATSQAEIDAALTLMETQLEALA